MSDAERPALWRPGPMRRWAPALLHGPCDGEVAAGDLVAQLYDRQVLRLD